MGDIKVGGRRMESGGPGLILDRERQALARDGMLGGDNASVVIGFSNEPAPGVIHVYVNPDTARREVAQFRLTPEVKQKLIDLQLGRGPGIQFGAKNDADLVKFLQAVAGLPQTGVMDRALEAFVRRIQSEARINVDTGDVRTKGAEGSYGVKVGEKDKFARFKVDGVVKRSMRAFIVKAQELGVLAEREVAELLRPFGEAIKTRLYSFVEGVAREVGTRARDSKQRWDQLCKDDGIEIDIPGIMKFVNKRWREFGLSSEVDELGAKRILAALKTIYRAESRDLGYSAANPGSSARGRYQFMPATIRECRRAGIIGKGERFPACATAEDRIKQDCVAMWLMGSREKGRRVLDDIVRGNVHGALAELSWEWAGLPASNGRSRYHGKAGNKATITYKDAVSLMTVNA